MQALSSVVRFLNVFLVRNTDSRILWVGMHIRKLTEGPSHTRLWFLKVFRREKRTSWAIRRRRCRRRAITFIRRREELLQHPAALLCIYTYTYVRRATQDRFNDYVHARTTHTQAFCTHHTLEHTDKKLMSYTSAQFTSSFLVFPILLLRRWIRHPRRRRPSYARVSRRRIFFLYNIYSGRGHEKGKK